MKKEDNTLYMEAIRNAHWVPDELSWDTHESGHFTSGPLVIRNDGKMYGIRLYVGTPIVDSVLVTSGALEGWRAACSLRTFQQDPKYKSILWLPWLKRGRHATAYYRVEASDKYM